MTNRHPSPQEGYDPRITDFFERFPSAKAIYADGALFHMTHSMNVPDIMREGLHRNRSLFPAAHGQFLLDICQKYGSGDPGDRVYIESRIIDPTSIYLTRSLVNFLGELDYGVPERLKLLMRSLFSLTQKRSLTDGERTFAQEAFGLHKTRLTEGEPAIVTLKVDPFAPAVVRKRLGAGAAILAETTFPDNADLLMQYVDGNYGNNIAIPGDISPTHVSVYNVVPATEERLLDGVHCEADWTSRIP